MKHLPSGQSDSNTDKSATSDGLSCFRHRWENSGRSMPIVAQVPLTSVLPAKCIQRHVASPCPDASVSFREADTYQPPLRADRQPQTLRSLGLHKVAGYGDTSWYSPQASQCMRPTAEMLAAREARNMGALGALDKVQGKSPLVRNTQCSHQLVGTQESAGPRSC